MNLREYLALDAVSASTLYTLHNRSPWHCQQGGAAPTEAQDKGSILHTLVLEPDAIEGYYRFEGEKRSNAKKAEWAAAEAAGFQVIRAAAWDEIEAEAEVIRRYMAPTLDAAVGVEQTLLWTDDATGIECRARPDILMPWGIIDLKRARSAHPRAWLAACGKYGHHWQAAWYLRGARVLGMPAERWQWAVCEYGGCPPVYYEPSADDLARVDLQLTTALRRYSECRANDEWPGYESGGCDLSSLVAGATPDFSGIETEDDDEQE